MQKSKTSVLLHIRSARLLFLCVLLLHVCVSPAQGVQELFSRSYPGSEIIPADRQMHAYLPLLRGKHIGVVTNHTAVIEGIHLVDTLLAWGIDIRCIFAPEHGFRGTADAGETLNNYKDAKTGIRIVSLYGKKKKPSAKDLEGIDLLVFDIQDVGVRFYTYISTLHYVMEACAEQNVPLLILDRPNPNGYYVDGPVLERKYSSFIGTDPVPVVYGMTIAEYARMLNGEGWLNAGRSCTLKYILCKGYNHKRYYQLETKPSPNLPNMSAVYLYPSLCFFEGTVISVGRGTDKPFQLIGHPSLKHTKVDFVPRSMPGARHPKYEGEVCHGFDLSDFGKLYLRSYRKLYLFWLISLYREFPDKEHFFNKNGMFNLLAGNDSLMQQIKDGWEEKEIRASWQHDLQRFLEIRKKYLLYEDF